MTYGVQTYDAAGATLLYSPDATGIFYNNAGFFNGTANLPVQNFASVRAVSTPVQTPSYYWNGTTGIYSAEVSATGYIGYSFPPMSASTYNAPVTIENSGVNCYVTTPTLNNITTQVYNFGTPTTPVQPNNYGLQAQGISTDYVSIDRNYKSYYIHPGPDGQNLRTATATSIPSTYQSSRSSYVVPTGQLDGQVIYFERTFVNPPLIFVTATTGPISFHFMTKNEAGLYNGMVIVAASSVSTPLGIISGTSFYVPNTYSFTYYIVSDELPTYKAAASYGIHVFNEYGTKVFDSSYFVPNFTAINTFRQPWFVYVSYYQTPSCSYTGSGYYQGNGIIRFGVDATQGVCINNWNSIKGHTVYTSLAWDGSQGSAAQGPTTFWGHYIDIQYSPTYGVVICTLQATGTNGILMTPTFNAAGWGNSWEYFNHNSQAAIVLSKFTN